MSFFVDHPLDSSCAFQHQQGLETLSSLYDVFIFDLWGVVHDGLRLVPNIIQTFENLKIAGKTVLILSNSVKRTSQTIEDLCSIRLPPQLYDGIYTSGEDCYRALVEKKELFYPYLGDKFFLFPGDTNKYHLEEFAYQQVQNVFQADFILCTFSAEELKKNYSLATSLVQKALKAKIPMICANSDRVIVQNGEIFSCCGALGLFYQKEGGEVCYHGKPQIKMYEEILLNYQIDVPKNKIVMIGDSLVTDIQGANRFGIDSIFISTGVDALSLPFSETFQKLRVFPTWMLKTAQWSSAHL